MRYTTIIDITAAPHLYKNVNVRLVYLHLVLKSGYHDHDRDIVHTSFRQLSADVGITLSACRHAVSLLERYQMLKRQGDYWYIRKFIEQPVITPRAKTKRQKTTEHQVQARVEADEAREREAERLRQERERLRSQGSNPWLEYYKARKTAAAAGELDAIDYCERYRAEYERQLRELQQDRSK